MPNGENLEYIENLKNLQNIYYITENGNYYVKLVFPDKEIRVTLKEGRMLIERMRKDQALRKKLIEEGFYGFYRVINRKYYKITLTEYQKSNKTDPYEVIKNSNLSLNRRLEALKEIKSLPKPSSVIHTSTDNEVNPTHKVKQNPGRVQKIRRINTQPNNIIFTAKQIRKIYLYEPKEQYIVYYKNGTSDILTKEDLILLIKYYIKIYNLNSLEQLYDMGIIEEVTDEKMNSTFKKYSLKDNEIKPAIEKIVLYTGENKIITNAVVFYQNGKTKVVNRSEAEKEILNIKRQNNIKSLDQLFNERKVECLEKFSLYKNFENYRNQILEKYNLNNLVVQEEDSFQLMTVDELDQFKTQKYISQKKAEYYPIKNKLMNLVQKLQNKFEKQLKAMKLVNFFSIGLGLTFLNVGIHTFNLIHNNNKVNAAGKITFSNAEDKNLPTLIGNHDLLQIENSLENLDQELLKAKKKREEIKKSQAKLKRNTVPQEEIKTGVPAEHIIIEKQKTKEKNKSDQKQEKSKEEEKTQIEENSVAVHEEQSPVPQQAEVPENNNQPGAINYIATYSLTPEQIDVIKATIQHEAGWNEIEVKAVTSTVINRCRSGRWGGTNPWSVITAPRQFSSYGYGYYTQYVNGNYADYTDTIVNQMLSGEVEPMHGYERFTSGGSGEQFTPGGNHYR